jgi:predicted nuclease of predicted toxin-antitoxin system
MHRAHDHELVDYARSEARVIVTFDLDFGDLLAVGVLD